jgi:hypothetical protein
MRSHSPNKNSLLPSPVGTVVLMVVDEGEQFKVARDEDKKGDDRQGPCYMC